MGKEQHIKMGRQRYSSLLLSTGIFAVALILFGLLLGPIHEIADGLIVIISNQGMLITDYIAIAGMGAAFVNAGLVTLISTMMLYIVDETPNGSSIATVGLMAGFSLFGKNIVNIWPIILGTGLYAILKREHFSRYVDVALRATALAPIISYIGGEANLFVGILVGVLIGFLIPPIAEYTYRVQNGMNLYNIGFACGLMAMMMVPAFKAFGLEPRAVCHWSTGNNQLLALSIVVFCCVLIAFAMANKPRKTLLAYWRLLHTSGRSPSDYLRVFGEKPVLVNMGINGLIATGYILLVGGDLNGPTIGAIFTIMGFSAYGKHASNIVPVMAGVLIGSLLNCVPLNDSAVQIAGLFCTTLAPISGFFGWPFGVAAGLIHSSVVLHAGLPLEGMNLYNNGFSGGLISIVLYPVITSLFRHRRPMLQNEDLFDSFEQDEPQSISELDQHKDDDIKMPH